MVGGRWGGGSGFVVEGGGRGWVERGGRRERGGIEEGRGGWT